MSLVSLHTISYRKLFNNRALFLFHRETQNLSAASCIIGELLMPFDEHILYDLPTSCNLQRWEPKSAPMTKSRAFHRELPAISSRSSSELGRHTSTGHRASCILEYVIPTISALAAASTTSHALLARSNLKPFHKLASSCEAHTLV